MRIRSAWQCARQRTDVFVAEDFPVLAAVLEFAQHRQHGAGINLFTFRGDAAQNLFDRAELLHSS